MTTPWVARTPDSLGRARGVLVALLAMAVAGCARRAPGPEECHELATRWVLWDRGALAAFAEATPGEAVLERTTECLTTPYDRELVTCVTAGGAPRGCYRAFLSRRTDRDDTPRPELGP